MDNKKFGEFIRELRLRPGKEFTLRDAAEKIKITSPYLSRIEAGIEKPPSQDVLERMAGVYEIDLNTLIEKASNRAKEVYGDLVVNNPALNVLFKVVRDLPDDKIEEVIRDVCKGKDIDPQAFIDEIKKRKMDLPRLRKVSEGLFAADIPPLFLSKVKIEERAVNFLKKHNVTRGSYHPPTPIEILAEKEEGIRLRTDDTLKMFRNGEPMELGVSHWSPCLDGIREIRVNYALEKGFYASSHRFRFTVGHELFHCIEHLPLMDDKMRLANALHRALLEVEKETVRKGKNNFIDRWVKAPNQPKKLFSNEEWREWQADYFSACVLMPDWSVKEEFAKRFTDAEIVVIDADEVRKIAYQVAREKICGKGIFERSLNEVYDVSLMAMAIRLMNLNLVHA